MNFLRYLLGTILLSAAIEFAPSPYGLEGIFIAAFVLWLRSTFGRSEK